MKPGETLENELCEFCGERGGEWSWIAVREALSRNPNRARSHRRLG